MKKDEQFVITINRELGSGGRTVGEKLAQRLGVPFYDKAVVKAMEEKYNLSVEEIEKLKSKKNNWWSDFQRLVVPFGDFERTKYYQVTMGEEPELVTSEGMYFTETEILNELAKSGSCVIAGRTGFHVLRNHPNKLAIFIKASMEERIKRVMLKQDMSYEEAQATIKKVDKMRENYVQRYTSKSRKDMDNYDLVISMDGITEDDAVAIILEYINRQK